LGLAILRENFWKIVAYIFSPLFSPPASLLALV